MSCSICNQAGHDEELHGEEGEEILSLREAVRILRGHVESARESVKYAALQGGMVTSRRARAWLERTRAYATKAAPSSSQEEKR